MKFWGAAISPGKSLKTTIPEDCTLRLTQVSLGEQVAPGRSVLTVTSNGQKFVIASLVAEKSEHAVMELMFEEGLVEFSVSGKNAIHLAGNMMAEDGDEGMMDEDEDEEMSEEEEEAPKGKKAAAAKKAVQQQQEEDDDDEDDDEEGEGEEEGDEDDDEEEGDDDDDDDDEEEEPVTKKRPAPGKAAPPPAKAQKGEKGVKAPVETPKKDAPKSAPATPGSAAKKEVPGEVKAKVRQILSGQAAGIKGADFPREWQKAHGTPFKDAFMKLGFKKQGEFMSALGDVVDAKGSGSEVTFFPKKK
eukprot:CAMPEP_0206227906 /NCGR_PEP_ID=MMETSP0047_2-20121206/8879_1 /ASSEMBLY_ACC=CAM_ASM_000192 /TAXON_ID=195065 /ORGANISM="Chroomonas mesostigmatica_cf, Strain CCMP1168" /LENGTH=301 /DNA_ID=CAMNT_0053651101 /DNA_START=100 /DNA_END=1005 /DNA_ORIENTATION=-